MMRVILALAFCSSILASSSEVHLLELFAGQDRIQRKEMMIKYGALRGSLVDRIGERMRGHKYVTLPNSTINGKTLMAELAFFDSPATASLTFWSAENTATGRRPHALIQLSLDIQPSIHQVVNSEDSLPLGESIEIKVSHVHKKRSQVIKTFNKQFGDFFKAWKDDFKLVFFTPSRDGMEKDFINVPIGGKPFRMFYRAGKGE